LNNSSEEGDAAEPALHAPLTRGERSRVDPFAAPLAGSPLRVFLVEDSAAVRDRLMDLLVERGKIEIIGFADTEDDAVRRLRTERANVAVVDLNLREGTGLGVIESVCRLQPVPDIVIAVLTNYAFPEFETACRERGAHYFFDKITQFGALKVLLQAIYQSRTSSQAPSKHS
jgi:two-component system, NarL family, response regulator DevR